MARTRISTTVDSDVLLRCREAFNTTDSELLDQALAALWREVVGARERDALARAPYDQDPDVAWDAPAGPDLPYDGTIPPDVLRLAAERRQQYDR